MAERRSGYPISIRSTIVSARRAGIRNWFLRASVVMTTSTAAQKFDPARAREYEQQSRIALAGYDACHELSACILAAALGSGDSAQILVAGAGGGAREILTAGSLEPNWRFTAVDPSEPMMD